CLRHSSDHRPAADADALDADTSLTTSAVSRRLACCAMSASATMPQQAPLASTTGARLIWFSSKMRQHSASDVSGVTVTHGVVMQSATVSVSGLRPFATVRQVMSRSVMTPMGLILATFSTTGISPQSCSTIISATRCSVVSGVLHVGSGVIRSFTCMVLLLLHFEAGAYLYYCSQRGHARPCPRSKRIKSDGPRCFPT